jgi:hypothetical protein
MPEFSAPQQYSSHKVPKPLPYFSFRKKKSKQKKTFFASLLFADGNIRYYPPLAIFAIIRRWQYSLSSAAGNIRYHPLPTAHDSRISLVPCYTFRFQIVILSLEGAYLQGRSRAVDAVSGN